MKRSRERGAERTALCLCLLVFSGFLSQPLRASTPQLPEQRLQSESAALSLEDLLSFALAHAPSLQNARARARLVQAELDEAAMLLPANPQLQLSPRTRSQGELRAREQQLGLRQEFEVGREPALRRAAAEAERTLQQTAVQGIQWDLQVEIRRLFLQFLLLGEERRLALDLVALSQELLRTATHRVESGEGAPLEVLLAEADLAQTRERVLETEHHAEGIRIQLAGLVGWAEGELPPLRGELPPVRPAPPLEELLEQMSLQHPVLRHREQAVLTWERRRSLAQRERLPHPGLGVRYAEEQDLETGQQEEIVTMTLEVSLPLWDRQQGERSRAAAELQLRESELEGSLIQLEAELREATLMLDAAAERVALSSEEVLPQLEESLRLLRRAYVLGEVGLSEVSMTHARLLHAHEQHHQGLVHYYEALTTLWGRVGSPPWPEESEG